MLNLNGTVMWITLHPKNYNTMHAISEELSHLQGSLILR